ncbi:protocatechuate 3,4-dioxygenase subunit beta [Microbulbifer taiwanensis]|uniref:protocatechuate 3,4-dioxygenase subunit beta n=1 Tax=Microbulbifer taiwanensis TaxID=986746 RepID=UPI00361DD9E7
MAYNRRDREQHPAQIHPDYKSSLLRGPTREPLAIAPLTSELTGPLFNQDMLGEFDSDLTKNGRKNGEPLGERMVVHGRVLDENRNPLPHTLIEIWQANAAGRYIHKLDQHDAPIDPNFLGAGRAVTDADGRYRFYTIKPGAYPWGNHHNAWRPNHIHFSLFGPSIATRLVTQMYFPGDPLLELDPIYQGVPTAARERLVARFDIEATEANFALGYRFDIVLRGAAATPMDQKKGTRKREGQS